MFAVGSLGLMDTGLTHCKFTNKPPSTKSDAPVTYRAISLARKTIGPATSAGSAKA